MTNESKRDWENLLTADDFDGFAMCCECLGDRNEIAEIANEIIKKELEKAPKVYGVQAYEEWMSKETADNCGVNYTHTARLVWIEEIKREPSGA